MILHDSNATPVTTFPTDLDGNKSLPVILQATSGFVESVIDVQNLATTSNFMLISLGDTGKWKHTLKNLIHVVRFGINVNPSSSYRGDVSIGFLSNTTATTGNFHTLKTFHFDQAGNGLQAYLNLMGIPWILTTTHWFGPSTANDPAFGHNAQLMGPDGYTHFGCYNGDMVMRITRTAGNVDVGIVIGYYTT